MLEDFWFRELEMRDRRQEGKRNIILKQLLEMFDNPTCYMEDVIFMSFPKHGPTFPKLHTQVDDIGRAVYLDKLNARQLYP